MDAAMLRPTKAASDLNVPLPRQAVAAVHASVEVVE